MLQNIHLSYVCFVESQTQNGNDKTLSGYIH